MPAAASSRFENWEAWLISLAERYGKDLLNVVLEWTRSSRARNATSGDAAPSAAKPAAPNVVPGASRLDQVQAAIIEVATRLEQLESNASLRIGALEERLSSELRRVQSSLTTVEGELDNASRVAGRLAWTVAALLVAVVIETVWLATRR